MHIDVLFVMVQDGSHILKLLIVLHVASNQKSNFGVIFVGELVKYKYNVQCIVLNVLSPNSQKMKILFFFYYLLKSIKHIEITT
jgi:hypothetical protein